MPKTSPLAPYDAFMLVSYGGPNGPSDVIPFLRNATGGAGIPDARLEEVGGHYRRFGGVSPINQRNAELLQGLQDRLDPDRSIPFVIGNRNWHPYFEEAMIDLVDRGCSRVLTLFTSAYTSYSGCRQYRENLAEALEKVRQARPEAQLELARVRPFANTPGFVRANATAIKAAYQDLVGEEPDGGAPHLVMVTHSIPLDMARRSGPQPATPPIPPADPMGTLAVTTRELVNTEGQLSGTANILTGCGPHRANTEPEPVNTPRKPALFEHGRSPAADLSQRSPLLRPAALAGLLPQTSQQDVLSHGWSYVAQHLAVAGAIVSELQHRHGIELPWSLAFCSRSGPPQAQWLEPDVNDHLSDLHAAGASRVIVAPFGFICDHMEVVFDLDTEAAATAADLGLGYRRAATAQDDPVFLDQLARVTLERVAEERGQDFTPEVAPHTYPALAENCGENCCQYVNVHARRPVAARIRPEG